ncbi:hypothetical protein LTR27_010661 [Elasticomyces elasticus]|nr:hypothetical protein LTR27_010661 [Elasticomyces elasticus]
MAQSLSEPFAAWDVADHSGPIIIVTTLCLLYWFVACTVQQIFWYARGAVFTWAHSMLAASMVAGLVQSTLVLVACHNGLGKSSTVVPVGKLHTAQEVGSRASKRMESRTLTWVKAYRVSNVFYAISIGLVKASTACFIASLTVKNAGSFKHVPRAQKRTVCVILALTAAWTAASAIVLGLTCTPQPTSSCMGTLDRWIGVLVGDAVTDLLIVAFAGSIILRTEAAVSKRVAWYLPFCIRLCVSLWAGLRLLSVSDQKFTQDPTLAMWLFIALTQVQVMLALLSVAFPRLRQTLQDLVTRHGASNSRSGSKHDGSKHDGSFILAKMNPKRHASQTMVWSTGKSSRTGKSKTPAIDPGDGGSQDGIILQDDFEVQYGISEASYRHMEGESRPW